MTTAVAIAFPWGRYHATAWTRSNNEGVPEWPPSPWRVLRALYSAWKVHVPDESEPSVTALLAKLTATPDFLLPERVDAQLRHYLPGPKHKEGVVNDTDKTLDTFVVMHAGKGAEPVVWMRWALDLDEAERSLLERLVVGVRYLGRAESIVDITVADAPEVEGWIGPVLVPESGRASQETLVAAGPEAVEHLTDSPSDVRKQKRRIPQGSTTVLYQPVRVSSPVRGRRRLETAGPPVTAARFSVTGAVLPSRTDAVPLGALLHRAALNQIGTAGERSETLSGRDEDDRPLQGAHRHAHFLTLPARSDLSGSRVASFVIWAPVGLASAELNALARLTRLQTGRVDKVRSRNVTLIDQGPVADVVPELVGPASVWESVTPYSPIRHSKGDLNDLLMDDIRHELVYRDPFDGVAVPADLVTVERIDGGWLGYQRYRPGKESIRTSRPAYGLRLYFAAPVTGPLALGQLSHFGLGLFRPIRRPGAS